jgi:energy-coupling factor transport system substrate-specific component
MIAWIIAGLPFDLLHGLGNLVAGLLILPLSKLLGKLAKNL